MIKTSTQFILYNQTENSYVILVMVISGILALAIWAKKENETKLVTFVTT